MSEPSASSSPSDEETRREVQAALAARRELGMEYEEALAAGLLDRVNQLALMRASDLRREADRGKDLVKAERESRQQRFVLGIISLGAGIPVTAIAATTVDPGLVGVLVAWAGIVGVNVAAGWNGRRRAPSS